jgi:hypothetical protein
MKEATNHKGRFTADGVSRPRNTFAFARWLAPIAFLVLVGGCARKNDSMGKDRVGPALGEESVPAGETERIKEIVEIHWYIQERVDRKEKPVPRGQHPKHHGCVRAEFVVEPELPEALRHGIFSEGRTYAAIIRFSNGRSRDDRKPDAHGMAIKLLGVEGEKVLESAMDASTQDFLMIDHPVFFVRDVADYIPLMKDFRRLATGNILAKSYSGLKVIFSQNHKFKLLRETASKKIESPLSARYWSTTPSRLGAGAMKFSARSDPEYAMATPTSDSKDRLREAMAAHLSRGEARFDFEVQLQTDPVTMPVEDPTVLWDETEAPFVKVATIRIPAQDFESEEQMAACENLSFTPWHALAEHRPLGGINRARKAVYEAMSNRRRELNGASLREPTE